MITLPIWAFVLLCIAAAPVVIVLTVAVVFVLLLFGGIAISFLEELFHHDS